jgi:hypothetical protein
MLHRIIAPPSPKVNGWRVGGVNVFLGMKHAGAAFLSDTGKAVTEEEYGRKCLAKDRLMVIMY